MGCFDVVCAFTNTPIFCYERCHLVVLPGKMSWHETTWLVSSEARWGAACTIFHGLYNDYGSIEPEGKLTEAQEKTLEEFRDAEAQKYFFVSDDAWKYCQEKYKDFIPFHIKERREFRALFSDTGAKTKVAQWNDPPNVEDIIELARVMVGFSHACKHPLSGLGCYHQYDGTDGETVREAMALTEKRLQAREKYISEQDSDGA